jgi:hypothetical protein
MFRYFRVFRSSLFFSGLLSIRLKTVIDRLETKPPSVAVFVCFVYFVISLPRMAETVNDP